MKYLFTCTPLHWKKWEGTPYIERMNGELAALAGESYLRAENADEADFIVYFEPNYFKGRHYADLLLQQEWIIRHPEKCFVINNDPAPIGHLPGTYTSLPKRNHDLARFRAGGYMSEPNPYTARLAGERSQRPKLMFSFRGSDSAPARRRLIDAAKTWKGDFSVVETFDWYNHSEESMANYIREILDSRFVLCPRGLGTASHRLFETMQLARVPVIIADEYELPEGPGWAAFTIRVSEAQVDRIPEILLPYEARAEEMGLRARAEWEQWFSPAKRLKTALDALHRIQLTRQKPEREVQKEWKKLSFYWPYGYHPLQSVARRLKEGTVINRVLTRAGLKKPVSK